MSDPAIDAAQRAGTDDEGDFMGAGMYNTSFDYAATSAREALAPIRAQLQASADYLDTEAARTEWERGYKDGVRALLDALTPHVIPSDELDEVR